MKNYLIVFASLCLLTACSIVSKSELQRVQQTQVKQHTTALKKKTTIPSKTQEIKRYQNRKPIKWGVDVPGVVRKLPTNGKVIALTFDACGGKHGSGYDKAIIQYLNKHHIPATLFINSRWIDANPDTFMELSHNPLFEIENHGTEHRPLSVTGRSVYGIQGTKNVSNVYNEINGNAQKIKKLTGKFPKFFRSGTAYYDDIAVHIVNDLNEIPVNFDIIGDAGATFTTKQVEHSMLRAKPGSIIILHMNQPKGDTAEGIQKAIPRLLQEGYHFVKLENYLKTK
ncbi:polysaccharide deacetylase family protein [Shimazuella sp. AN120528]|uniref:polysaccharide deacetylase family protein n=1 Tax=Shimazuella soli TaxID=1892854 RepID=UPI001F0F0D92|nr:polysaccharide deacetylase family protein [Shimazuella soli]MCH5585302.1 polysaccharide deacetylase family protein [Shimazuella soli]